MPRLLAVELSEHDAAWEASAAREAERLGRALGTAVLEVHHIGSTAIRGFKPAT